jgi:hypothetical protein
MPYIEAALSLLDRLAAIIKLRSESRAEYFESVIHPAYGDALVVVEDYFALVRELISRLEAGEDLTSVIRWLEERRMAYLPLRIKLRGSIVEMPHHSPGVHSRDLFVKGIWGVMRGGLALSEDGHMPADEYGQGNHTVLDFLYHLSASADKSSVRRHCLARARWQLAALQRAWEDATQGYYECRDELKALRRHRDKGGDEKLTAPSKQRGTDLRSR